MGIRKNKSVVEQAAEFVEQVVEQAKPKVESAVDTARERAVPLLQDAKEKAGPKLADARDKAMPVIADGAARAAEKAAEVAEVASQKAAESRDIEQGNPAIPEFSFFTRQGITISVTTLEWNYNTMLYGLGAGNTTISGSQETFAYGGDPCKDEIALRVEHRKCTATHTIFIDVWKAVSADGTLAVQMGQEEHMFAWTWKGLRSSTNWAGQTLAFDEQLVKFTTQLT